MSSIEHLNISVSGLRLHVAVAGEGPLVVLLHGFPELWSAWHHQIPALAAAGFRVAAPDLRGFGRSDGPESPEAYTLLHLAGDVIGIIHALGEKSAVVIGHDWGGPVAWHSALLRPDVVRAVAGLSTPYRPRAPQPPTQLLLAAGMKRYYWFYMATPAADAELSRDVEATMRTLLFGVSADAPAPDNDTVLVPENGGFLDAMPKPAALPAWVDREHFENLVSEYQRTGFRKPLYLYHNFDRNWELLAAWSGKPIEQPALFLGGDRDPTLVNEFGKRTLDAMPAAVPNVKVKMLGSAGHWLQQEKPAEVTAALLEFLRGL